MDSLEQAILKAHHNKYCRQNVAHEIAQAIRSWMKEKFEDYDLTYSMTVADLMKALGI